MEGASERGERWRERRAGGHRLEEGRAVPLLLALAAALALLAAGAFAARHWFLDSRVGPLRPGAPDRLRIEPGENFGRAAAHLAAEGWVRWSLPVRLEARWKGWDRRVFPGYYRFRPGETVGELLGRLARGEIEETHVTIPEGWRLEQILPALADSVWVPLERLTALAADSVWLAQERVPGPGLEGYLFPETYWIPRGEAAPRVLRQLLEPGVRYYDDSLRAAAAARGLDRRELWTLASMVEAEARLPEERSRIAAVFWNRLRRGMRLESDPTVLYALGRPAGRVLYRDLEVDSPYNTYRYAGLPPGPIDSPGRASLQAVVHPLEGCRDLFFVARGDGSHVFSQTLAAHNRAKARIRRERGTRERRRVPSASP